MIPASGLEVVRAWESMGDGWICGTYREECQVDCRRRRRHETTDMHEPLSIAYYS